jgi:hypothetical protein
MVRGQIKKPWDYAENGKELFVKNQTTVDGAASPDLQSMIDPASQGHGGQAPPIVSSKSASFPADFTGQSSQPDPIVPDGVKVGHD